MKLRPIAEVGAELGLSPEDVLPWGRDRAKVSLEALGRRSHQGRLVLVECPTSFST
ncbi:MAG TPA: hypothetical protein VFZ09_38890 [Archangium sp.]|uniref:hypothetical protein n=1 Tax=Archangium sp. TaxID=1872627 RepID=UPI002E37015A|nr:hypothetical protein [Archangium sp.]HEX5752245.1 hypothetical protein [Archangium sp.]